MSLTPDVEKKQLQLPNSIPSVFFKIDPIDVKYLGNICKQIC